MDDVIKELIPAIEEQLTSPETLYVKTTYDRLLQEDDIDEDEAKAMMAFCLADEIEVLQREERVFDAQRYETLLNLLPAMPEGR